MASYQECVQEAIEAGRKVLTPDEIRWMFKQLTHEQKLKGARGTLKYSEQALLNSADELANTLTEKALIWKRNSAINIVKNHSLKQYIDRFDTPGKGLAAKLAGTDAPIEGGRLSTDARGAAIRNEHLGGFVADLREEGLLRVWNSGGLEKEIAQELSEMHPKGRKGLSGSKEAAKLAGIIGKWQRVAMERLNRAGANIATLRGHITKQSHSIDKIRRAGFKKWSEAVHNLIDPDRSFAGQDPEKFLKKTYEEIITGRIFNQGLGEEVDPSLFQGVNIAKKASASRYLHFKNYQNFLAYQKEFGAGSLMSGVHQSMERSARNIALLEDWGPNPERMLDKLIDEIKSTHIDDPQKLKSVTGLKERHLKNLYGEVSGDVNIPVSHNLNLIGRMTRMTHNMSKLGGVLLSSLVDPVLVGSEFRFQGSKLLGSYVKTLQSFLEGRGYRGGREIADRIGVGLDGIRGGILARFSNDDMVPGAMSSAMQTFFRLSGLTWWNDSWKSGVGLMFARDLARQRHNTWNGLSERLQTVFKQYEIGEGEWNLLRRAKTIKDDRATGYLVPGVVENISDEAIGKHLGIDTLDIGVDTHADRKIRRYRDELATKLRSYITDRTDYAVLTPGAREQAYMHQGLQPGTVMGEALRFMWQFKSFPFTYGTKMFGRELSKGRMSGVLGLVHLTLATTILGYVAKSAKDLSRGRTPRDPSDPKTWQAAFIQGGGAGIYGDFIFGEYSRFGHGLLSTAMGPTATTLEDFASIYSKAVRGEPLAAKALRTAIQNTPYINLFYTRAAFDYLFFYHIQEALNPGYLRRMERSIKKHNKQTFIIPPSKVVGYGGRG